MNIAESLKQNPKDWEMRNIRFLTHKDGRTYLKLEYVSRENKNTFKVLPFGFDTLDYSQQKMMGEIVTWWMHNVHD
jgi:hypothetical protein